MELEKMLAEYLVDSKFEDLPKELLDIIKYSFLAVLTRT